MPRTARASLGGWCYHVLNRGNGRAEVFHKEDDYAAFVRLFEPACERLPIRILGYCLMPNHFHLVLWPHDDGDLGRWMQWLLTSHVRRYHRHYGGSGHVWQGRFKAFPIQDDDHYLTVLRYVERNPLRAKLTRKAESWRWSSCHLHVAGTHDPILAAGPIAIPNNWATLVHQPQTEAELAALRRSVQRGTPFGGPRWTPRAANELGLQSSLRPRGRPRKHPKK
jgi:REP-associated tyrosine transposase